VESKVVEPKIVESNVAEQREAWVSILMGSGSDWPIMESTVEVLEQLGVPYEVLVTSAHRTPEATAAHVKEAEQRDCAVFICAAGLAAHLAGAVAAQTIRPVIGVPIDAGPLVGFDALLSTVQMPGGIPVATVAVGKTGARNAAYLAAQILGLADAEVDSALRADREANADRVAQQNAGLAEKLAGR
jgi:5-(carboxyamino)imidazole ribonucleotide mutase